DAVDGVLARLGDPRTRRDRIDHRHPAGEALRAPDGGDAPLAAQLRAHLRDRARAAAVDDDPDRRGADRRGAGAPPAAGRAGAAGRTPRPTRAANSATEAPPIPIE